MALKEGKYQNLSEHIQSQFDISINLSIPVLVYLICETLKGSGLQALLICGTLQGLYSWKNLGREKRLVVLSTVRYLAYMMRQIGAIVVGILAPVYFRSKSPIPVNMLAGFTAVVVLLQLLIAFVTMKAMQLLNYSSQQLLSQTEVIVTLLSSIGSGGLINFIFAFGTRND